MGSSRTKTPTETPAPSLLLTDACHSMLATAARSHPLTSICCALSGGVDSVVLLHLLSRLQPEYGFRLQARHVHHGLSPHADDWVQFCENLCDRWHIPLTVHHVHLDRNDASGIENAARKARMQCLENSDCDWLALGHHQNDQAETVLLRLLRGTGVHGLAAMAPFTPPQSGYKGRLRPLLTIQRGIIETYARTCRLSWVEDESNDDTEHYRRNAIRHRILPELEVFFPGAVLTLSRTAGLCREADVLLAELAAEDALHIRDNSSPFFFNRFKMAQLSDARIIHLLRWQLQCNGRQSPPHSRLTEMLRQFRQAQQTHQPLCQRWQDICWCAYRQQVWLETALPDIAPEPLQWHGETSLAWAGGILHLQQAADSMDTTVSGENRSIRIVPPWTGLTLRLHPGRPRRQFKQLCQEAAIPPWLRHHLPVLVTNGEPAWVSGIGFTSGHSAATVGLQPYWRRPLLPVHANTAQT